MRAASAREGALFMIWLDEFAHRHGQTVAVVAEGLSRVEREFASAIESDLECVRELCGRVERYRGKMLRPAMTLLSGMAAATDPDASPTAEQVRLAAVVEMIHVATLVHDDVLDEADVRRQAPTISALRGNEAAVILGDYLISAAFRLCSSLDDQSVALRVGETTSRVCAGELLQLHHRQDLALDEETYWEIIERKTASLIGVACELGAGLGGAGEDARRRMREFGVRIGVAFQIQDDLLDLTGEESVVGKDLGKDLEKGKLTLPLIHHFATAGEGRRRETAAVLRSLWTGAPNRAPVNAGSCGSVATEIGARAEIRAALESTGSIAHAADVARRAVAEAKASLGGLPGSAAVALLRDLADGVLNRDR